MAKNSITDIYGSEPDYNNAEAPVASKIINSTFDNHAKNSPAVNSVKPIHDSRDSSIEPGYEEHNTTGGKK